MVFEENQKLGGAWQTEFIDEGKMEVEIACHLIENHGNSYSLLSEASGVEFRAFETQPVKFYKKGSESPYSSRRTIWRETKQFSVKSGGILISFLSDFGSARVRRLREMSSSSRLGIIRGYLEFLRFRFPKLLIGAKVKHPVGGNVSFINGLVSQAKLLGVDFIKARVVSLQPVIIKGDDEQVQLTTQTDEKFLMDRAILSKSVTLTKSGDKFLRTERAQKVYSHAIYFLPSSAICREIPYMHFVDDLDVHRVTFLDSDSVLMQGVKNEGKYLLAQFRNSGLLSIERRELFFKLLKKHKIISADSVIDECKEHALFEECFYGNALDAPLSAGMSNNTECVRVLDTIGDLGRLVVLLNSGNY